MNSVLYFVCGLVMAATVCNGQNITFSCDENWCGERWRSIDRILLYNYTTEYENVTFVTNRTYEKIECSALQLLISPNGDPCKVVNVTQEEKITYQIPRIKRSPTPEINDLPRELTLQLIATENIDLFGNETVDNYDTLEDKIWQIWIPRKCRMVIFLNEFDLETSTNCSKDYFSIQTSKQQQDISKYCGSIAQVSKIINIERRRRVQMIFHSDDGITRKGVHATFCFQSSSNIEPDVPCACNADTSAVRRRHTRGSSDPRKHSSTKRTHSHSHSHSHSKSRSHKSKQYMSKKKLKEMMIEQDQKIGETLRNMMSGGLKAVNHYRFSNDKSERLLAEKYQEALYSAVM